ncbi:MAG: hypothetical protein HQ488_02325 [Parcubacteria group bacterium]|nr:hypothetical protein [Parcubacteria group bacterium]
MTDQRWRQRSPLDLIGTILLIMLMVSLSAPHYQATCDHMVNPDLSQLWPLPPPPDRSHDVVTPPTVITVPTMTTKTGGTKSYETAFKTEAVEVIRVFIALHPVPELRNTLLEDVDAGRVQIIIATDDLESFRFDANRGEKNARLLVGAEIPGALATNDELNIELQSELYYRFLIYEHWKQGGSHNEIFLQDKVDDLGFGTSYQSLCQEVWEVDLVAWEGYCNMMVYSGRSDLGVYCLYLDTSDWLHSMFSRHQEQWTNVDANECLFYMAKQAGHPNPNVFR